MTSLLTTAFSQAILAGLRGSKAWGFRGVQTESWAVDGGRPPASVKGHGDQKSTAGRWLRCDKFGTAPAGLLVDALGGIDVDIKPRVRLPMPLANAAPIPTAAPRGGRRVCSPPAMLVVESSSWDDVDRRPPRPGGRVRPSCLRGLQPCSQPKSTGQPSQVNTGANERMGCLF